MSMSINDHDAHDALPAVRSPFCPSGDRIAPSEEIAMVWNVQTWEARARSSGIEICCSSFGFVIHNGDKLSPKTMFRSSVRVNFVGVGEFVRTVKTIGFHDHETGCLSGKNSTLQVIG